MNKKDSSSKRNSEKMASSTLGGNKKRKDWDAKIDNLQSQSKFEKSGFIIKQILKDELTELNSTNPKPTSKLHKYQIEAVQETEKHFSSNRGGKALIVAPPGSGKSGMIMLLPYVLESKRVLIFTPSCIISQQLAYAFGTVLNGKREPFLLKSGICTNLSRVEKLSEKVYIPQNRAELANIAVQNNLVIVNNHKFPIRQLHNTDIQSQLREFDTIIVDEAHHYPAATWKAMVDMFENKHIVFLTATPFRGVQGLAEIDSDISLVREIKREEVEGKTIRKLKFDERPNPIQTWDGDSMECDGVFLQHLETDIYKILAEQDKEENSFKHQAMILVHKKEVAIQVATKLKDAVHIVSDKDSKENLEKFTDGEAKIAVVCGMLLEGYDNANVSLAVILRKCNSRVLFEQFCGRCVRMQRDVRALRDITARSSIAARSSGEPSVSRSALNEEARPNRSTDKTSGIILSYVHYGQKKKFWDKREEFATADPDSFVDEGEIIFLESQ